MQICSNEVTIKNYLEEIIKIRIQADINDSFNLHGFVFNNENDTQLNLARNFLDYLKKLDESMSIIQEYKNIFSSFNVNYIKICFFDAASAGDRVKIRFYSSNLSTTIG